MLNKIIAFSLKRRVLILLSAVLLLIAGLYTTKNMEIDVFPDLNAPTVVVMTEANGMAPEEVERLVTFPVETAVNGATDVRRVRSSSTTGFSIVWIEFDWGTDIYRARQIIGEKISGIGETLPPGVSTPVMAPQSSILGEVMFVSLTSDKVSQQELRTIADWSIRPRLLATGGVAQVSVIGGEIKEYQIQLNPDKMRRYGVSLDEVSAAVEDMNRNVAGGVLYEYGNEYIIRGDLATNNLSELGLTPVKNTELGDKAILLNQVADIKIGNSSPKMGVASEKGKDAVIITVTKQPNTGTIELSDKIDETLTDIRKSIPEDINISTDIYRQERFINSSIHNVVESLYEGGIFVVIILFIFLMNVRTTIISLITIPLSLVVSILALHLMGFTINTMSLGGMAIAIGSLVDDAIVDVENVYKRLRQNRRLPEEQRLKPIKVVFEASKEVRMPILNSTLIIVASFLPLFFLSGMEGRMLAPLGVAFIVALAASTLVALTLTPVLCSYLLTSDKKEKQNKEPIVSRFLANGYSKLLEWTLAHKKVVLSSTIALFVVALVIFCSLGRSFLPPFNEGSFTINISTMPGISLEESQKIGARVENMLLSIPEIKTVGRKTGRAELDEHALGVNNSEIEAPYELKDRSKDELMKDIRQKLSLIPGISVEVGAPISHRIDAMLSGTKASIAIKLFGTDLNRMYAIGNQIKSEISDIEGIADLNVEQQVERPQLRIEPKREMLAQYGITMPEFSRMVSTLLGGTVVSQVYEGNKAFDLVLKIGDGNRATMDDIRNISIDANGRKIPLSDIARVTSSAGPNTINRENVARKLVISANVSGRDLLGVVTDIQKIVGKEITLPEGYHIEYGGQFESERTASRTLLITSIFSILAIFLLLYNQFKDFKQSAVILLNLPLALIGGVFSLWITNSVISIPATIGFISLFGIATRNGMLLVARYNDLREQGHSIHESVMIGSADRLNPILMTALTSALALIPMAVGGDLPGNEIQSPMAKVILGGLFTSTLLNGLIVPIMYIISHKEKRSEEGNSNESDNSYNSYKSDNDE
jgi:Cu(I)/Ag(I) efflux system membrane protein CusA/SilA